MIKRFFDIVKLRKKEAAFAFLALILLSLWSLFISVITDFSLAKSFLIFLILVSIVVLTLEIAVRLFFEMRQNKSQPIVASELCYEGHPYLPLVYKPSVYIPANTEKCRLLNRERAYTMYGIETNSQRVTNGPDGKKEIITPKTENILRVACLGESTTACYLKYKDEFYSLPLAIEKNLQANFPDKTVEVINYGQGGWSSAEILINFLVHVFDHKPDIVYLLCGFNDIGISLQDNFKADYSHARRNLSGFLDSQQKPQNIFSRFKLYDVFFEHFNTRMEQKGDPAIIVNKGRIQYEKDFSHLTTLQRNLEHLIKICQASGIKIVLSTYAYYTNRYNEKIKSSVKTKEGIAIVNQFVKDLSEKYNTVYADLDEAIPREERYFVDSMHLSHEGINLSGECVATTIKNIILKSDEKKC